MGAARVIGRKRIPAAVLLLLPFAAAPAAAGQSRAVLSVSAVVTPSCQIEREGAGRSAVACSAGTRFSTATIASHEERPLDEAAAILGGPARGTHGVEFAAPIRATVEASSPEDRAVRYHTITY